MANGNRDEDAKGDGIGEFVVSKVRGGMKREFAAMVKAHLECGISPGQRRTRRSQNSALGNAFAVKDFESNQKNGNSEGFKDFNWKRRKAEVNDGVVGKGVLKEKVKVGEGIDVQKLVIEEDEIKSDVVDGNTDDELKRNLVEDGMIVGEGEKSRLVGMETEGDSLEIKSIEFVGVSGMGSEVDEIVGADGVRGSVNEEHKDGVAVAMKIIKEKRIQFEPGFEAGNVLELESPDVCYRKVDSEMVPNVGAKVMVTGEIGELERPVRRFTRSLLKANGEKLEQSPSEVGQPEEIGRSDAISPSLNSSKLEMKMSKKVELKKVPTKLKELLETGLLEGLTVQYYRGSRFQGQVPGEEGLRGQIQGSGILCFCDKCKGNQVVTPNQFELHAGSGNKRPPEFIYLKSGKTLRDVLNVCKSTPSDSLELAIRRAIGYLNEKESIHCMNFEGSVPKTDAGKRKCLRDSHMDSRDSQLCLTQADHTSVSSRSSPSASTTLSSGEESSKSRSRSKSQGRLTRKDLRLHKLVFESDFIPDATKLGYYVKGKKILEGHKTDYGIYCYCCEQVVSPSVFEAHAGFAPRRKPYLHIYTSEGTSLHEISIQIKKMMESSTDENDDVCSVCEATGELICCDNCPRAFHIECVELPSGVPQDKWYCRYCESMFRRENYASYNINAVAAGRIADIDPFEDLKKRCIRIMETLQPLSAGCAICGGLEFCKEPGFGPDTVILCDQCEGEYHVRCLKVEKKADLKDLPKGKWLCGEECISIDSALQKLVSEGEKQLPDLLLDIIRKKHANTGLEDRFDLNVTWRLLHSSIASDETRRFFSGAISVCHERFGKIMFRQKDLIPLMAYGRGDYHAMYCATLLVNSVVVSVAFLRIFGTEMAEIPLVATRIGYEGKGYLQSLFSCIENILASLDVKHLVLPSACETISLWKKRFGFQELSEERVRYYRKRYKIELFVGAPYMHRQPRMHVA